MRNQKKFPFVSILFFGILFMTTSSFLFIVVWMRTLSTTSSDTSSVSSPSTFSKSTDIPPSYEPFPVGVNLKTKTIEENALVNSYYSDHIASKLPGSEKGFLKHALAVLTRSFLFQNLASIVSPTLIIDSGERKEEIAEHFGKVLSWNTAERKKFLEYVAGSSPELAEGIFFPGFYTISSDHSPEGIASIITNRFNTEVLSRYDESVSQEVPLKDTLIIASLLEREARDFTDMREISGIIWNRLFIDMRLQLDASLQYAKGSLPHNDWWPKVTPADKYIISSFNTYAHEGLPPQPIANPSLDAILAALNPKKTDCLFYFHDARGNFHCSETYDEHVALIRKYYGR